MEWFVTNPTPEGNSKNSLYASMQWPVHSRRKAFSLFRWRKGFKPIGDYIHSLGLKFGIHILRGIPKNAVASNAPSRALPTTLRCGRHRGNCPWNPDNFGADAKSLRAGLLRFHCSLYASWESI